MAHVGVSEIGVLSTNDQFIGKVMRSFEIWSTPFSDKPRKKFVEAQSSNVAAIQACPRVILCANQVPYTSVYYIIQIRYIIFQFHLLSNMIHTTFDLYPET